MKIFFIWLIFFLLVSCGSRKKNSDTDIFLTFGKRNLPKNYDHQKGLSKNTKNLKGLGPFSVDTLIRKIKLVDTIIVTGYSKDENPHFLATYKFDTVKYHFLVSDKFMKFNGGSSFELMELGPGGWYIPISKNLENSDQYRVYLWARLFSFPMVYYDGTVKHPLRNYLYLYYWPRLTPSLRGRRNRIRWQNLHFYKAFIFIKDNDLEEDIYLRYFRILFHFDFNNFSLKNIDSMGKNGKIQLIDLTNNKKYLIEYSMIFPFCYNLIPELDE